MEELEGGMGVIVSVWYALLLQCMCYQVVS